MIWVRFCYMVVVGMYDSKSSSSGLARDPLTVDSKSTFKQAFAMEGSLLLSGLLVFAAFFAYLALPSLVRNVNPFQL